MDTCRPGPRRDGGTSTLAPLRPQPRRDTAVPGSLAGFAGWCGPIWFRPIRSAGAFGAVVGTGLLRRRQLLPRRRAVVLRRRLRAAFPDLRFGGRCPTILWCRAHGADVLISLYCPAGAGFEELHRRRAVLSAVASVPEVHVDRHPRSAKIVTLTMNTRPWEYVPGRRSVLPGNVVPLRAPGRLPRSP